MVFDAMSTQPQAGFRFYAYIFFACVSKPEQGIKISEENRFLES